MNVQDVERDDEPIRAGIARHEHELLAVGRDVVVRVAARDVGRTEQRRPPAQLERLARAASAESHRDQLVRLPVIELTTVASPHRIITAPVGHEHLVSRRRIRLYVHLIASGLVGDVRHPVTVR